VAPTGPYQHRGLLDDFGGLEQHVLGDGEAERLGRLEVDPVAVA
jgi:hypothetical protein